MGNSDHIARFWHLADDGRVQCDLCPRGCALKDGQRAFCFVREARDGAMHLSTYGRSTGFCIDPIEKKPLNHFYPGTSVLSFGTAGCNLGCKFCQNWTSSKSRRVESMSEVASPEAIAEAAVKAECRSVAFTYNDPVIWAEYAIDTAKACHARGVKTVAVTAGYITKQARAEFFEHVDAANVDLKAFDEEFYRHLSAAHLAPVLETLEYLVHETEVWLEITNLVIPQHNDADDQIARLVDWVAEHLGPSVPLHFSAFHPDFEMTDLPRTPAATLLRARERALSAGLRYVYTGNVHDAASQSTYCHGCDAMLIERDWYRLGRYTVESGACQACGCPVEGHFDDERGSWGPRRSPIKI